MKLQQIQEFLRQNGLDGWLLYDFRQSNPYFRRIIGSRKLTSRRCFLFIPVIDDPVLLISILDRNEFRDTSWNRIEYSSYSDMITELGQLLKRSRRIAMEYSQNCAIPYVSILDAGTYELIHKMGIDIVSSADIFQHTFARWTDEELQLHLHAAKKVSEIKDDAFSYISENVNNGLTEYDVQQFILNRFTNENLVTEGSPIVAVNENSANPHYVPTRKINKKIHKNTFILIDLWARVNEQDSVFADITWVSYVGNHIPTRYITVFDVVKGARNNAIKLLEDERRNRNLHGWEIDDLVREYITQHQYGKYFLHRTGHSLSPGPSVHGLGVNLDNYETQDTRKIVPGVGFSIEPGIYLYDRKHSFGIRSEINAFIQSNNKLLVTTPIQNDIIKL